MSENDPIQRMFNRVSDKVADGAIKAILGLLAMLIRPLATLTEIFVRRDFGERYYTLWNWYGGCTILTATYYGLGIVARYNSTHETYRNSWGQVYTTVTEGTVSSLSLWTLGVWAWSFHILAIMQWWSVRRRYKNRGRWYSRSIGVPRIPGIPASLERVLLLIFGACLVLFNAPLPGGLMIASASTTILLRWHEARTFRNRVLDTIDDQIEQEYLAKAVMDRSKPQDVDGFRAPLPAYVSTKFRERVIEAFGARGYQVSTAASKEPAYNTQSARATGEHFSTPAATASAPVVDNTTINFMQKSVDAAVAKEAPSAMSRTADETTVEIPKTSVKTPVPGVTAADSDQNASPIVTPVDARVMNIGISNQSSAASQKSNVGTKDIAVPSKDSPKPLPTVDEYINHITAFVPPSTNPTPLTQQGTKDTPKSAEPAGPAAPRQKTGATKGKRSKPSRGE